MKAIFEGAAADIASVLTDKTAAYNEARATLKAETAEKRVVELEVYIEALQKKLNDKENSRQLSEHDKSQLTTMRSDVSNKNTLLAAAEAKIQELQFKLDNPISLSPEQESEIEKLYQKTLKEYGSEPFTFLVNRNEVTAEMMLNTIFQSLASGDRVGTIKIVRDVSGMGLTRARDLIYDALRKFGCNTNHTGAPVTKGN